MINQSASRADLSKAWSEGHSAGKKGDKQLSNPYLTHNNRLAQEWNQGWLDGNK